MWHNIANYKHMQSEKLSHVRQNIFFSKYAKLSSWKSISTLRIFLKLQKTILFGNVAGWGGREGWPRTGKHSLISLPNLCLSELTTLSKYR